jgi:hypothetical protein
MAGTGFIPYANTTQASNSIAPSQWQFDSIAPAQNNMAGAQAAYNASPAYDTAANNTANSLLSGAYQGGGAGTGGAGGAAASAGSQADIATYTDNIAALNGLLGQADTNRAQGEQGINQSFNTSNARLADQQAGTMQNYDNQQTDTTKGYQNNLNTIDNQARSGYQSLQALLGGSGSAGEVLAPLAVSNQAGTQTNAARDGLATNLQSITNARKDAQNQYTNAQNDLLGQKNSKLSALISSIDQQKQNYLSQIGQQQNQLNIARGGSYATPTAQNVAIQQLQNEQNNLINQYQQPGFTPLNVNVQAPNLNPYIAQAAQIGGLSNAPQGSAPTDPSVALQALIKAQQEKQNNQYAI